MRRTGSAVSPSDYRPLPGALPTFRAMCEGSVMFFPCVFKPLTDLTDFPDPFRFARKARRMPKGGGTLSGGLFLPFRSVKSVKSVE